MNSYNGIGIYTPSREFAINLPHHKITYIRVLHKFIIVQFANNIAVRSN